MNQITEIAVNGAKDPMQEVMGLLFGDKCEVFISDEVLECMKKSHSYNMVPCGKGAIYTFNKRGRATHIYYSFTVVTDGRNENKVSKLECTTEIGVTQKNENIPVTVPKKRVYITLKEE